MTDPRPTLRELAARARLALGEQPLRRTVEDVLARTLAGAAHGLHGRVRWVGDQILPDRATGAVLDRWARFYGLERVRAAKASGHVWFIVSGSETVPAGTRLRDVYGHTYIVTEEAALTTPAGFTASAVEAEDTGAAQNLESEEGLYLLDPIAGVTSPGFVYGDAVNLSPPYPLTGGADDEEDRELRARVLARMGDEPLGGAPGTYETLAKRGGAPLAWEAVEESGAGTVTIYVGRLTDPVEGVDPGGQITGLTTNDLPAIQAYVDEHCPITVDVTVASVAVQTESVTVALTPDTADIREAVELELRQLFAREAIANGPGNTIPVSRIKEAISLAEGLESHVLSVPSSPWTASAGSVLARATMTYV